MDAVTRAFELRDHANEREQYFIMGGYYHVTGDIEKSAQAYQDLLALDPDDTSMSSIGALNVLGIQYMQAGQFVRAETTSLEALRRDSLRTGVPMGYEVNRDNLAIAQTNLGKYDEARATLLAPVARLDSAGAGMPTRINLNLAQVASAAGDYETAEQHLVTLREGAAENPRWGPLADRGLAALAALHGRIAEAREGKQEALAFFAEHELGARYLSTTIQLAGWSLFVQGDTAEALASVEAALARFPWADLPIDERPSDSLSEFFAAAGETGRARAILEEHERESRSDPDPDPHHDLRGRIALAEGDYLAAVSRFKQADNGLCPLCALPRLALAHDRADNADSALAAYERYVTTPYYDRLFQDQYFLGPIHERLGQLYDDLGDQENALRNYSRFVELWREADPELQPRVRAAQARLEEILAERG
jgi:tetratricopeptide (TPR) repeat protein